MIIANFINIYTNIYIPILYATRITQNKNDSLNSSMVVLLTITVVQYFLLQDFGVWSCVPDSENGKYLPLT